MNSKQINETLNCLMSFMQEVFSEFFFCHFCETTSLDELEKLLKKCYSSTVAAKLYLYLRKTP